MHFIPLTVLRILISLFILESLTELGEDNTWLKHFDDSMFAGIGVDTLKHITILAPPYFFHNLMVLHQPIAAYKDLVLEFDLVVFVLVVIFTFIKGRIVDIFFLIIHLISIIFKLFLYS